ncbi:gamma-glutamyltransferase [Candidatus Poriferisocius sp.]|uniref:gamma-glutamyltransferase n=1 Tax=Candidatus Poriferisocius sp. TaxID=3101276 RepID=UPI003B5B49F2
MSALRPVGAVPVMAEQCSARGVGGVTAAAAPQAARIGAAMLERGGNAYDAVVAAALAETVLLPPKCGLAGDLVALSWAPQATRPEALIAVGGAPAGLADAARRGALGATGPVSVGVPGAPAGYRALAERGTLAMAQLAAPAVRLADEGFAWARICSLLAEESRELLGVHNPDGTVYLPGGDPIAPGTVTRLPGLARAMEMFGADPESFLRGDVGEAMIARVRDAGGVLRAEDMAFSGAAWVEVASATGLLGTCFVTPAPTHGPSLLDVVQAVGARGPLSQGDLYRHVMDAIARRRATLADPSGTSMVSAVDRTGQMVTVIHSNSFPQFGSGLVVPEYDLVLSNRAGRGFSTEEGHPNFPRPGRKPATTLHAWAIAPGDGRRVQGATPGGANQMPWNAQTLARLMHRPTAVADAVAEAVVEARWEWRSDDDGVRVEEGMADAEVEALGAVAPRLERVGRWGLRSAMQIVVDDRPEGAPGTAMAVVDPRTGGGVCAL